VTDEVTDSVVQFPTPVETKEPQPSEVEVRKVYGVVMSFKAPFEGTTTIAARDVDHARALIMEQFKDHQDLRIIDIFDVSGLKQPAEGTKDGQLLLEGLDYSDITPNPDKLN